MINDILLYTGAGIITLWGIGHIAPIKSVVSGFEPISEENRRIITMEWAAEGLTLCFIGVLVLLVTILGGSQNPVSLLVFRICGSMLVIMAIWTALTGARTSIIWIKICPAVKTAVAILFFLASAL